MFESVNIRTDAQTDRQKDVRRLAGDTNYKLTSEPSAQVS